MQGGDGAEGDQLPVRAADVDVAELLGVHALRPQELRDDLVAAPRHAEAVDEVAADGGRQVLADRL